MTPGEMPGVFISGIRSVAGQNASLRGPLT
jgi:hypothetical protein